jgi:hypothetical protein
MTRWYQLAQDILFCVSIAAFCVWALLITTR